MPMPEMTEKHKRTVGTMIDGEEVLESQCRRCAAPLRHDPVRNNSICRFCYPKNRVIPKPRKEEKLFLDVKPDEKKIKEMIENSEKGMEERIKEAADAAAKAAVEAYIESQKVGPVETEEPGPTGPAEPVEEAEVQDTEGSLEEKYPDWRAKAKELDIDQYHKSKKQVLKEIEAKSGG
jgi:hypothetical protein